MVAVFDEDTTHHTIEDTLRLGTRHAFQRPSITLKMYARETCGTVGAECSHKLVGSCDGHGQASLVGHEIVAQLHVGTGLMIGGLGSGSLNTFALSHQLLDARRIGNGNRCFVQLDNTF